MTASLEVRVRDYLARNGTDVSLTQVAVHLGEPRRDVAAIIAQLDLDQPTHVEPEDIRPPAGPTLTYEETAAPKPRRARRGRRPARRKLSARATTGRRSNCPCDGDRCRRCTRCREAIARDRRERVEARARETTCPNCSGPGGPYRDNTCDTCANYENRTGAPRPPELYSTKTRTCRNCAAEMPKGKSRRHGRCEACARYWDRTGRERPERLWRHTVGADTATHTDTPDTATSTQTEPVGTGASRGMPSPGRESTGTAPTHTTDRDADGA